MSRSGCISLGLIVVTFACTDPSDDGAEEPGMDDGPSDSGGQTGASPTPSPAESTRDEPGMDPAGGGTPNVAPAAQPTPAPSGDTSNGGATSLHIQPAGTCYLGDTWLDFPAVAGGHPVTATSHDSLAEDGVEGWRVSCTYRELSTRTTVTVAIRDSQDGDQQLVRMSSDVEGGQLQPGSLRVLTSDFLPTLDAPDDQPCEYQTIELDLPAGRVWGSLQCGSIANGDSGDECQVGEGYFYFENCKPFEL